MPPGATQIPQKHRPVSEEKITNLTDKGHVTVTKSFTKDLGQYNSAKVTIGMTVPIGATKEELDACDVTIKKVIARIDKLLDVELDNLMT